MRIKHVRMSGRWKRLLCLSVQNITKLCRLPHMILSPHFRSEKPMSIRVDDYSLIQHTRVCVCLFWFEQNRCRTGNLTLSLWRNLRILHTRKLENMRNTYIAYYLCEFMFYENLLNRHDKFISFWTFVMRISTYKLPFNCETHPERL